MSYPPDCQSWPLEKRNAWFADEARKFRNWQANGAAGHVGPSIAEAGPTPRVKAAHGLAKPLGHTRGYQ